MKNTRILTLIFVLAFLTLLVGCIPPIEENQAPIITSNPITTATVGEAYTYDVDATDPDGDTLTYSLATPAGMTINSATGVISWLPSSAQVGDNAVKVVVSDGDLSVTQNFTIKVSKPTPTPIPTKKYTITATAGANGAINPSGAVKVKKGKDKLFTITPDTDYHIVDVLVDGSSIGAVGSYNFTNVTANHTIEASFAIDTYTITATASSGGSISPSGTVTVNEGSDKTFTITPYSPFYRLLDVLVDSVSVGVPSSYPFTNVIADHTIHANFILIGPVYNQTQDDHYNFIQDAINSMTTFPGDTILVMAGTYDEDIITIGTAVTLQAITKHEAVIKGSVHITADSVTVDGFSIKNFKKVLGEGAAIYTSGADILIVNSLIDGTGTSISATGILTASTTAEATLEDNIIRNCHMGIYANPGAELTISNNTIENMTHCGIGLDTSAGTLITGNTISNCADQWIEVFGANVVANFNNIAGNPGFGVQSFGPLVDAKANWWGDASGPKGMGPGTGDAISTNVDYIPWSTSAF